MDTKEKNKWKVRGAVLVIFLLGFAAGILALNAYDKWAGGGRARQGGGQQRLEQSFEQLKLTEQQQTEVRGVFEDARNQMREMRRTEQVRRREIRRQTDERLQKILTAEQWRQFQQMRNEDGGGGARRERRQPQQQE